MRNKENKNTFLSYRNAGNRDHSINPENYQQIDLDSSGQSETELEETVVPEENKYDLLKQYRLNNPFTEQKPEVREDEKEKTEVSPKPEVVNYKAPEEFKQALSEYLSENSLDSDYGFWEQLVGHESGYQSIQNKLGAPAYGYFQLWETNLGGHSPEEVLKDPNLQFKLAIDLDKRNMSTFTEEDFKKAKELGYTKNAMRAGAWLGGVEGVRDLIHRNINRDDKHHSKDGKTGSSVEKYMSKFNFRIGGTLENTSKVKIGSKNYNIDIVESDEDKAKGLSERDKLSSDEGMLFIIKDEDKDSKGYVWFTMEDTKFPLDIIFINENYEVVQVSKGEPLSDEQIYGKGDYVLEVITNSGINVGDKLEFNTEKTSKKSESEPVKEEDKMLVLDPEGKPQMTLDGGERIFSIHNTKILINFANKSNDSKEDKDYKALGKRVFKFLKIQDSNEPEYVE